MLIRPIPPAPTRSAATGGYGGRKAQPQPDGRLDRRKLRRVEVTQHPKELRVRNSDEVLGIEGARGNDTDASK